MDLRDLVHVLRRRWRSIVAILVLALLVAGALTFLTTPLYQSKAQLFISTASTADNNANGAIYANGLAASQKAPSYARLVTQSELTTRVVDRLRLDMTPAQLADKLDGAAVTDTAQVEVTASDPDPRQARRICAAAADELSSMIAEIETPPRSQTPLLYATVTDAASLPTSPASPNLPLNLAVATLLGLLLGMALAITRERLDNSVRTHADIEDTIGTAILGSITNDSRGAKERLIDASQGHTPLAEAFRVIRTNLQFIEVDADQKSLVVTSAVPGEGKTTTAVNASLSLAAAGHRVLLVDADLRRPRIAEMLDLESAVGVTTMLLRRVELEDAIQKHVSGLHVLASGAVPPNPAELLQSHAMAELLARLRALYDIVIIDSPPLLPVTDAALLATQTDGALLVVRFGKTTRDQIAGAAARLDGVGGRMVGAVVNRAPVRGGAYGYGYGYGYGYAPLPPKKRTAAKVRTSSFRRAAPDPEVPGANGTNGHDVEDGRRPPLLGDGPTASAQQLPHRRAGG